MGHRAGKRRCGAGGVRRTGRARAGACGVVCRIRLAESLPGRSIEAGGRERPESCIPVFGLEAAGYVGRPAGFAGARGGGAETAHWRYMTLKNRAPFAGARDEGAKTAAAFAGRGMRGPGRATGSRPESRISVFGLEAAGYLGRPAGLAGARDRGAKTAAAFAGRSVRGSGRADGKRPESCISVFGLEAAGYLGRPAGFAGARDRGAKTAAALPGRSVRGSGRADGKRPESCISVFGLEAAGYLGRPAGFAGARDRGAKTAAALPGRSARGSKHVALHW